MFRVVDLSVDSIGKEIDILNVLNRMVSAFWNDLEVCATGIIVI